MMARIASLFLGMVIGAVGAYVAMTYHLVRADDGLHFVPKMTASLADTFVDVRSYGLNDWQNHPTLTVALVKAKKEYILKDAATETLRQDVNEVLRYFSAQPRTSTLR